MNEPKILEFMDLFVTMADEFGLCGEEMDDAVCILFKRYLQKLKRDAPLVFNETLQSTMAAMVNAVDVDLELEGTERYR